MLLPIGSHRSGPRQVSILAFLPTGEKVWVQKDVYTARTTWNCHVAGRRQKGIRGYLINTEAEHPYFIPHNLEDREYILNVWAKRPNKKKKHSLKNGFYRRTKKAA